jgi:hypothetical protein
LKIILYVIQYVRQRHIWITSKRKNCRFQNDSAYSSPSHHQWHYTHTKLCVNIIIDVVNTGTIYWWSPVFTRREMVKFSIAERTLWPFIYVDSILQSIFQLSFMLQISIESFHAKCYIYFTMGREFQNWHVLWILY